MATHTRRAFLRKSASIAAVTWPLATQTVVAADDGKWPKWLKALHGQVGVTTSSLSGHLVARAARGKFTLLELPGLLRNELDMKVIDLNTSALASNEPAYLESIRTAADDAGCVLTNLKLNQRDLDMSSPDRNVRERALTVYKASIDSASRLGIRWARPLPLKPRPDMKLHIDSYRELADYATERDVQMLVENFGWMESDPESVVKLVKAIGRNVAACPDTGNWSNNETRYAGLANTFPTAVTCDYKARKLGPAAEHDLYDLERCFRIGWQAGFRGPWCLEHANAERATLFRELALLRDNLRKWMKS